MRALDPRTFSSLSIHLLGLFYALNFRATKMPPFTEDGINDEKVNKNKGNKPTTFLNSFRSLNKGK